MSPSGRREAGLVDSAFEAVADATLATRTFLASPQGKRLRHQVATVFIVGAPIVARLPVARRSLVARLLGTAAMATLIVKGAEWLRDWEPVATLEAEPEEGVTLP